MPAPPTAATERRERMPLGTGPVPHRKTVVQVLLNLGHGGMEAMAVNLARGLDSKRFRAVIIALDAGGEHERALQQAGIEYYVLQGRRFWRSDFHRGLARLLRAVGADVVHTHNFAPLVHSLPATWLAHVRRRVHTEHSYQYLEPRADYRRVLRWISRSSDAFVVVGHSMRSYYQDRVRVATTRLRTIPNGIDTQRYRPARNVMDARRALDLPVDAFLIGTAGRFFPEKDYGTLLRGVAALSQTRGDARLVMVGEGPERPGLEALVAQLGIGARVQFTGWRTDLADLLPALDVFVLSSRSEGLPLVALEALACAVPVVATPVGDLPEVIANGQAGILFPVADATALAQALTSLADDGQRRRALGLAGRQRVLACYSQEAMVDSYVRAYEGMAEERR